MAREIVINVLCDICVSQGKRSESATEYKVTIDEEYTIDLCEAHSTHVNELIIILDRYGRKEEKEKAKTKKEQSYYADCHICQLPFASRSSLRSHLDNVHDVSLNVYEGRLGKTVIGEKLTEHCDQCEAGFTDKRSLAVHIRRAH